MPRQRKPKPPPDHHRPPGLGSAYPIAGGRFRGALRLTLRDGTQQRLYVTASSKREAYELLAARREALLAGKPAQRSETMTLRDLVERWLREAVLPYRRQSTAEAYVNAVARVAKPLGDVPLSELERLDLERCYAAMKATGVAPATIRLAHACVHRALEQALQWRLVTENVARGMRLPSGSAPEFLPLSVEQVQQLLLEAERAGDPYAALWTVLAETGIRRGEALGLRWRDVDLEQRLITVRGQVVRTRGGGIEWTEPKTRHAQRPLRIGPHTVYALRRQRAQTAGWPAWHGIDLVFCHEDGRPYGTGALYWHWRQALRRADLPSVRLHDLRHGFTTEHARQGTPVGILQSMLGHASSRLTMDVYTHIVPTMQDAPVEAFHASLWAGFDWEAAAVAAIGEQKADSRRECG